MSLREKGKIIAIGHIINGEPENWQFNCEGKIAAIEITADSQILYAGYSISELEQISNKYWES